MQLFKRPEPPGGIAQFTQEVKTFRERIEGIFGPNKAPAPAAPAVAEPTESGSSKRKKPKKEDPFAPKWSDYKAVFAEAQNGKCGYCEMMVTGGHPGDVEHYWPKGEVWQLPDDPAQQGQERRWASTIEGRKRKIISETGYWWLAYDWSNYLLACTVCNQYWKLSYFPVKDDPRAVPPTEANKEVPLLLNPFDDTHKPSEHLRFDDLGQIQAKDMSPWGSQTIRTCGLDRESLRRSRVQNARRAHKLAQDLNATNDPDETSEILNDFYELGRIEYVHSGMVRALFEDLCGLTWTQLEELVDQE